jgi:hypothetical protein
MRARVTKQGLIIPKKMLRGVEEVEIRQEDHRIVISPLIRDPILDLAKDPVVCGVSDGSENHDHYLYRSNP